MICVALLTASCNLSVNEVIPPDVQTSAKPQESTQPDINEKYEYLNIPEYIGLYDYSSYNPMSRKKLEADEHVSVYFEYKSDLSFDACVYAASFGTGGSLELSLYAWNGDYRSTLSGNPIKSREFHSFSNGTMLKLSLNDGEPGIGKYLLDIKNTSAVTDENNGCGVYINRSWSSVPENISPYNPKSYIDGEESDMCAMGHLCIRNYDEVQISTEVDYSPLEPIHRDKANVIFLCGQSNASGMAQNQYLYEKSSDDKNSLYREGFENIKIFYDNDMSNNASNEFVNVKTGQGSYKSTFGPELGLAEYLSEKYPDERFYIIKCAMGGTSLYTSWSPRLSNGNKGSCLTYMEQKAEYALNLLKGQGEDPQVIGFIWMQGESDGMLLGQALDYYKNEVEFIKSVREFLSPYAPENGIAFIDGGINDCYMWDFHYLVNFAKACICSQNIMNTYIDTQSYNLNYDSEGADRAHYDSLDMIHLGRLFGEALDKYYIKD